MSLIASARQQWLANPRRDLLAGTVVALALIPEAIAFSIIAGVDPAVGLYASVVIAVTIAFVGGRPAMISAATGAMALLMVTSGPRPRAGISVRRLAFCAACSRSSSAC
jgi:sulfate permease, SulP family